jgi:hypothetical protein
MYFFCIYIDTFRIAKHHFKDDHNFNILAFYTIGRITQILYISHYKVQASLKGIASRDWGGLLLVLLDTGIGTVLCILCPRY